MTPSLPGMVAYAVPADAAATKTTAIQKVVDRKIGLMSLLLSACRLVIELECANACIVGGRRSRSHRGATPDFGAHARRNPSVFSPMRPLGSARMSAAPTIGVPLLERTGELARIESVLDQARVGRGGLVVVEGPAGIGKTALLAAARAAAQTAGMRVLRSRGAQLEREFAFGIARQLFEPSLAEASETERADLLQGPAGL